MERKRTLERSIIPIIEQRSFYDNSLRCENELSLIEQEKQERINEEIKRLERRSEFTTYYFKHVYDEKGNCTMIPRPYDEV